MRALRTTGLTAVGLALATGLAGCVIPFGGLGEEPSPTPTVGNRDWDALEVGDCVSDDLSTDGTIPGRATMVQCAGGKARAQLVATTSTKAGSRSIPATYETEAINKWCQDAFESYLGIAANKSSYLINWIKPDDGTTTNLQCFAASRDLLPGSLQGAKA